MKTVKYCMKDTLLPVDNYTLYIQWCVDSCEEMNISKEGINWLVCGMLNQCILIIYLLFPMQLVWNKKNIDTGQSQTLGEITCFFEGKGKAARERRWHAANDRGSIWDFRVDTWHVLYVTRAPLSCGFEKRGGFFCPGPRLKEWSGLRGSQVSVRIIKSTVLWSDILTDQYVRPCWVFSDSLTTAAS